MKSAAIVNHKMEYHTIKFTTCEISRYREILASSIDPEKKKRIDSYHFQADRDRAIVGDALSRTVICRNLGLTSREISIRISPYGKPFVGDAGSFEFNLAHSGNWIVCGAGAGRIGVDVERIGEADAWFAERYFTPHESDLLRESCGEARRRLFYSIWTLKESYIKALGKGLAVPLEGFSIRFQSDGIRAHSEGRDAGFRFRLFKGLDADFSFAMCSENPPPQSAHVWTLEGLAQDFRRIS